MNGSVAYGLESHGKCAFWAPQGRLAEKWGAMMRVAELKTPGRLELPTYRSILRRVAAAAIGLAVVIGTTMFFIEVEVIDDRIVAMASKQSATFLRKEQGLLQAGQSQENLERALADFMRSQPQDADGRFIVAEIYGPDHKKIAEHVSEGADWAEERLKQYLHPFPEPNENWYNRFFFDGIFFIQTMTPLVRANGDLIGYFEGVYQVPAVRSRELVRDIVVAVAASVLSVLATAGVLLPLFVAFNRNVMVLSGELLHANIDTLSVLGGTIAKRDSDTHAHNYRVTIMAIRLAEALALNAAAIRSLIKGAFLHDVGKIGIPDRILLKPGKLDDDEFAVMKTHVSHGTDIVARSAWLADARDVVGCHHEKYDGTGYPKGIAGNDIPVNARIFAIVDVFDALTSRRPYKEPLALNQALDILRAGRGKHFDPAVLDVFLRIVNELHHSLAAQDEVAVEGAMRDLVARYFNRP